MVLDLPADASVEDCRQPGSTELHEAYRADYQAYYDRHAIRRQPRHAWRRPGHRADPRRRNVQLRQGQADRAGGGRVLPQRDQRHARRRGHLHLRPDRRERRSSASSTGRWRRPSWRGCPSPSRWPPASRWSPARRPASARPSPPGWRPRAPASSSPTWTPKRPLRQREEIGNSDVAIGIAADVTDEDAVQAAIDATRAGLRRHRHRRQQRRAVAVQVAAGDHRSRLGPAAQRDGPRLVPGVEGRGQAR